MYSVAVDSLSLTASVSPGDLKGHWSIPLQVSYISTLNGYARGPLDPVAFVGANTANSNTVAIPSHQVGDLVVVFALNTNGGGANNSPVTPLSPSGQPQWTDLRDITLAGTRLKIAYLFATQNTTVVGAWVRANRTTVAVYRNTKGFVDDGSYNAQGDSNLIVYNQLTGLAGLSQPHILGFGFFAAGLGASTPPTGFTARTSTDAVGENFPGIGLSDRSMPNGTNVLSSNSVQASLTSSQTFSALLTLEAGIKPLTAETGYFQTSLNGDIKADSIIPRTAVFRAELSQVFTSYASFYDADSVNYASTAADVDTHFGYYLAIGTGSLTATISDGIFIRQLEYFPQSGGFGLNGSEIYFTSGYFVAPQGGGFTSSWANVDLTKDSVITLTRGDYEASDVNALFKRSIIEAITGTSGSITFGEVGIRNDAISPAGGQGGARILDYGGSNPSYPSFLRTQNVRFNSVLKSRDLGQLNNFKGTFTGEIGAECGTQTLFFKCQIQGPASIQITKNFSNRYTDKQISIGILDSNRKQVQVNDSGFAYENENESTELSEFLEPMPQGTYYFTISSSLWQKIPYSVNIQAIRFIELKGSATVSAQLSGRFAIAKLRGAATLTAAMATTIPSASQLKGAAGAAVVSSGVRGTLVIPSGVAIGRMTPYGRLKMTHKISGSASLSNENLATLTSEPPLYGGYGSP